MQHVTSVFSYVQPRTVRRDYEVYGGAVAYRSDDGGIVLSELEAGLARNVEELRAIVAEAVTVDASVASTGVDATTKAGVQGGDVESGLTWVCHDVEDLVLRHQAGARERWVPCLDQVMEVRTSPSSASDVAARSAGLVPKAKVVPTVGLVRVASGAAFGGAQAASKNAVAVASKVKCKVRLRMILIPVGAVSRVDTGELSRRGVKW